MKSIRIVVVLGIFVAFSSTLFANGGPLDYSHFRKTGNIRLMRKADVELVKENLTLKVVGDYTEVEVEYHLRNKGKDQDIQYGFPVDAYGDGFGFGDVWPAFQENGDFVKYFRMSSDGLDLKVAQWIVDSVYVALPVRLYPESEEKQKDSLIILRKWYATTLRFKSNETKILHVSFKLKNTLNDKWPGFEGQPRFSRRHFTYHLTPSGNWGNGLIGEFNVKIDVSDLIHVGCIPNITGISGISNLDLSGQAEVSFKNYDLTKSDRLEIDYDNSFVKYANFISKEGIPHSRIKSIRASRNNEDAKNLLDDNLSSTWKGKKGDWIEVEFLPSTAVERELYGIYALNGNYRDAFTFARSGRMLEVKVLVNDSIYYNAQAWFGDKGERKVKLESPVYKGTEEDLVKGCATRLAEGWGLYTRELIFISKIRIEIVETDQRFGDSCEVSELYFTGD